MDLGKVSLTLKRLLHFCKCSFLSKEKKFYQIMSD